jgi:hypothetical protein
VLSVLEGDDGSCISWDSVDVESVEDGVTIEEGERIGDCVQWLTVSTEEPQETVSIRARSPRGEAVGTVGLSGEENLPIHINRSGRSLAVRVGRGQVSEGSSVHAYWDGGSMELESSQRGVFRGQVPADAIVGVVARSGGVVGASFSIPDAFRSRRVNAILMPSELAVPAGGAPRTAAFLIVTNQRGRPSNTVPLNITSERGRLRGMSWIRPGLAAIQLSTEVGVTSVDLTVSFGEEVFGRAELAVSAGWATRAQLELPATVTEGEQFELSVTASSLDGDSVTPTDLRVRCGGE